jgi:uncharacterized delta-60 repeat protein
MTNGKIMVGGNFSQYRGEDADFLVRLNPDGTRDDTFDTQGIFNERVKTVLVQGDKFIVAGWFTECHGSTAGYVVRLNSDGTCDQSFNSGSGANNVVETIEYDNNDRIMVGGTFTTFNGITANRLTRLNPDGSVDEPFQLSTLLNGEVYEIQVLADDSFIFVGGFSVVNGSSADYVARMDEDGVLIPFPDKGEGTSNKIFSLEVLSSGNIVLGGEFYVFDGLNANRLALLSRGGAVLETLDHRAGANDNVYEINHLPGGKILVGGRFTHFNGVFSSKLAMLDNNGSIDPSFSIGTGFNADIYGITVQPDGKLLIGGSFTQFNGQTHRRLVRLLPDGSLDPSFQIGNGFNLPVYETIVQPDGKILVAGFFSSFQGQPHGRILRLNPDGSLDGSFNAGIGFDNYVEDIHLLNDGRILAVGDFTNYQNQPHGRIIRLNADGSVDQSFKSSAGFSRSVNAIDVASDGNIVVVGLFFSYNDIPVNRIVRLEPDGDIDQSFDVGSGLSGFVLDVESDSKGRVIVVGGMGQYNGEATNYVVRLKPDGSLDHEYFSGLSLDGFVHTLSIQADDNVVIGGDFNRIGSDYRSNIARLLAGVPTSIDDDGIAPALPSAFSIEPNFPNPFNPSTTLRVNLPQSSDVAVTVYDLTGRVVMQLPTRSLQAGRHNITLDASRLGSGVYVYRVSAGSWIKSGKMTLVK